MPGTDWGNGWGGTCCCCWVATEGLGLGALDGTVEVGGRTWFWDCDGADCGGGGSQGNWATPRDESFFCQLCNQKNH